VKNTPGPGNYSIESVEKAPSYSLRSRPIEKVVEKAPGPGKYDPKTEYVLESQPNFGIGKSEKKFETELERNSKFIPGPGTYGNSTSLSGPKWGFGSSERVQEKKMNVPGPGAYNV
jgi:hypothetical protein